MGYIFVVVALVLLVIVVLARGRPGPSSASVGPDQRRRPTEHTEPASDEPTPGASATNTPERVKHAQEHTPPS